MRIMSVETPSQCAFKVAANLYMYIEIYCMEEKRNRLKTPEEVTSVVYHYVILFRMYERDISIEKEFDTVLQMTLENVLTQRFKQSTKLTAKVTHTKKYM